MTNEEIEKKFEFDLAMNVFTEQNVFGSDMISFRLSRSSYKLLRLLLNIGYTLQYGLKDRDTPCMYKHCLTEGTWCIEISKSSKTIFLGSTWYSIKKTPLIKNFNKVPYYIRWYKV